MGWPLIGAKGVEVFWWIWGRELAWSWFIFFPRGSSEANRENLWKQELRGTYPKLEQSKLMTSKKKGGKFPGRVPARPHEHTHRRSWLYMTSTGPGSLQLSYNRAVTWGPSTSPLPSPFPTTPFPIPIPKGSKITRKRKVKRRENVNPTFVL